MTDTAPDPASTVSSQFCLSLGKNMDFEHARQKVKKNDRPLSGKRLHLRLPTWKTGLTAALFGVGGLGWPTMPMFYEGDFYGNVPVDPSELELPTWEVVTVVETGENTEFQPNAARDSERPPHRVITTY